MSQTPDNTDSAELPTERLDLRVTAADKLLLRVAAAYSGTSISAFVRKSARDAARIVVHDATN